MSEVDKEYLERIQKNLELAVEVCKKYNILFFTYNHSVTLP